MSQLLNVREVCLRLGIGRSTFFKNAPVFIADGLTEVKVVGQRGRMFTEESVEELKAEAARTGNRVGELRGKRRGRKAGQRSGDEQNQS